MNKHVIPREVNKWLQSLDLTYRISNPRRDLSNGFIIAEILSRRKDIFIGKHHHYDMRMFNTGLSMEERQSNWKHLKKLFEYNKIPIGDDVIQKVINQAPNSAFELLLGLYKFLTKRE